MSAVVPVIATAFTTVAGTIASIAAPVLTAATAIFSGGAAAGGAGLLSAGVTAGAAVGGASVGGAAAGGALSNLLGGLGFSASSGFGSVLSGALSKGLQGAVTGGIMSVASGGEFMDGAKIGGIGGIVTGGLGALTRSAPGLEIGRQATTRTPTISGASAGRVAATGGIGAGAVGTAAPAAPIGQGLGGGLSAILGEGWLGNVLSGAADGYARAAELQEAEKARERQAMLSEEIRVREEDRRAAQYAGVGDSVRQGLGLGPETGMPARDGAPPDAGEDLRIRQQAERLRRQAERRATRGQFRFNPQSGRVEYG